MTPNAASAGSTPPKVETKNYHWVAPSWLVYIYIIYNSNVIFNAVMITLQKRDFVYSILFYSILFFLFYSILFYSILFYSFLYYSILLNCCFIVV